MKTLAGPIVALCALLCAPAPAAGQALAPVAPGDVVAPVTPGDVAAPFEPGAERPNVVVLMTDDQTVRDMRAMPRTAELIGAAGATFPNAFVNNPRCCPSRATFLTGQYSHNHGVLTNGWPQGGWPQLRGTSNWLPTWLQQAGYHTVHFGKFLNLYGRRDRTEVPPGWDEWYATIDPTTYRYYNYKLNENGEVHHYGRDRDPRSYSTDMAAERAVRIVDRLAPRERPFFLSLAFLAPHTGGPREPGDPPHLGTPAVAPRHRGAFAFAPLPRPASFNEADVSDKPPPLRRPRLGARAIGGIRSLYRQRLESLLAVDEAVERIVIALGRAGELDDTLVVFTSDNGYLAGEHRLPHGKAKAYDPVTRVPLMIRGPGILPGSRPEQLVVNADLAPTILAAAGASPRRVQDGRPLQPLTHDPELASDRPVLIEIARGRRIETKAIRTPHWAYVEHPWGRRELYDVDGDPQQLDSLHRADELRAIRLRLRRALMRLRDCRGAGCRREVAVAAAADLPGAKPRRGTRRTRRR